MLTIAPPLAVLIMAGIANFESRNILSTLTCITRRYCSASSSTTLPRLPIPTLLSRKSSRPQRSTAASTNALQSASLVTSPTCAAATPPSAAIISTVRPADLRSRSPTNTLAPARASSIAAARPLPIPSSAAPPPLMSATLPVKPESSSSPCIALLPCLRHTIAMASQGEKTSPVIRKPFSLHSATHSSGVPVLVDQGLSLVGAALVPLIDPFPVWRSDLGDAALLAGHGLNPGD